METESVENNDSKGYLTVEATLSLTIFLFFMMFLMNMGQIYQTQNFMTHGLMQTGKNLAFNSYSYEQVSLVAELTYLTQALSLEGTGENVSVGHRWKDKNYKEAAKETFVCICEDLDNELKKMQIKKGIEGIDFSGTTVDGKNLVINAKYDIELPFAFFNFDKVTMHQKVVCGLWK